LRLSCLNCLVILCGFVPSIATHAQGPPSRARQTPDPVLELARDDGRLGSPYIPLDIWVYPALMRLQGLGYVDGAYLGLRAWTRLSVANMLAETSDKLNDHPEDEEAWSIFQAVTSEIAPDLRQAFEGGGQVQVDHVYTRLSGIAGTPLRDSFHVGQTIVNDYGRPYGEGFNNATGFGARGTSGRFSLDFRGEFLHAASATGYSMAVAQTLSAIDTVPFALNQATIPQGRSHPSPTFA